MELVRGMLLGVAGGLVHFVVAVVVQSAPISPARHDAGTGIFDDDGKKEKNPRSRVGLASSIAQVLSMRLGNSLIARREPLDSPRQMAIRRLQSRRRSPQNSGTNARDFQNVSMRAGQKKMDFLSDRWQVLRKGNGADWAKMRKGREDTLACRFAE